MIYRTYARHCGVFWIYGWFLVGMSGKQEFSGYAKEFLLSNCKLMLLQDERPVGWIKGIYRFWFVPKKTKVLERIGPLDGKGSERFDRIW